MITRLTVNAPDCTCCEYDCSTSEEGCYGLCIRLSDALYRGSSNFIEKIDSIVNESYRWIVLELETGHDVSYYYTNKSVEEVKFIVSMFKIKYPQYPYDIIIDQCEEKDVIPYRRKIN